jgi:ABC-2 type transport system ATP-binding protein
MNNISHPDMSIDDQAIVRAENLSKRFEAVVAVDRISFEVHTGEIFGFLGPNGAGKTTTINMLTGLARMSTGSIFINGIDCDKDHKTAQSFIGVVPDESNLYDDLSGYENLCFCGALYGMRKELRQKRATELLKHFGLWDSSNKLFKHYSKGMKRKLTIAAGIIHSPSLLFLDEPTTGIDVSSARQIRTMIRDLNQEGVTIFLTTHYLEEAERLCDRIAFIVNGKIIRLATLDELVQDFESYETVEFIFESENDKAIPTSVLQSRFPDYKFKPISPNSLYISSAGKLELSKLIAYCEENEMKLYEAKRVKPSLEDIFVNITEEGERHVS